MEKRQSVDQRRRPIEQFFATHEARLAQQGSIVAAYRQRGARRFGPYFCLTCRTDCGEQVSVYLGIEGPLVAEARQRLAALQAPARQRRQWKVLKVAARQELRAARRVLGEELAKLGLIRKGAEIRGWRQLG